MPGGERPARPTWPRLDRRFVVTPTIRLLSDIAVRAVEELDQRDIGTGKSRLHLPGAFNWTTIAR